MEYESEGVFWINDEAGAVRGRLTFTESDGGELRLEDLLFAGDGEVMASVPLIRGQALDGTRLSLVNTFPTSMQVASPTMPVHPHEYFVNRVVVGLDDPDTRLQEVRLDLHRLLDFTETSGLSITAAGTRRDEPVAVEWQPPADALGAKADEIEVAIAAEHRVRSMDYEISVEHRAEVAMRHEDGLTFEEWFRPAAHVEGLISFFLGFPTWIERFYSPAGDADIDHIYQLREGRTTRGRKPWLTQSAISEHFQPIVAGWFGFAVSDPEAFLILNEYLRFGGRLLQEDRVLYLARVIELYHRGGTRFAQILISREEQRKRVREVVEAAPSEHEEWVREMLSRSNEKTLRERITDLVASFAEALAPIVPGTVEEFAASATDNRNYFTHYSSYLREKGRVLEGRELHELVLRLLFVVRACVLREMGFAHSEIRELLARDGNYRALSVPRPA